MPFLSTKKQPSNFVIFQGDNIVNGDMKYEDIPKYLGAIDQFRAQGATEMADNILNKMLEIGHPAAMAKRAEDLLLESENKDCEALELFEKAASMSDPDSLLKYSIWILRGRICPDRIEDALRMLKEVANQGHGHLTIAAPAYFLKQIALGINHKESNKKLDEWLKIWNPKDYKKYKKGKISQQEMLAPVAMEAGLVWQGN